MCKKHVFVFWVVLYYKPVGRGSCSIGKETTGVYTFFITFEQWSTSTNNIIVNTFTLMLFLRFLIPGICLLRRESEGFGQ